MPKTERERWEVHLLATAFIARTTPGAIVVWTDGSPIDEEYSRRNVVGVGRYVVLWFGKTESRVPAKEQLEAIASTAGSTVISFVNALADELRQMSPSESEGSYGALVGGFTEIGRPSLFWLPSHNGFTLGYGSDTSYVGLDATVAVRTYLSDMLGNSRDLGSEVDWLLLAGEASYKYDLSDDLPRWPAIAVLRPGQQLCWLSNDELMSRQRANSRRLVAVKAAFAESIEEHSR